MAGSTFRFEVNRTSSAPPSRLFALETDGAGWAKWAKPLVVQSSWERRGGSAPGGVGAIRKVGLWPVLIREETLEFDQDRRHVYTFSGPAPAKEYRAEVLFTPNAAGGTDLRWQGSFREKAPGTGPLVRAALHLVITFVSARLVKAAERPAR
jgi:uncharacterized protein YndB with AHSA1/START domain